MRFHQDAKTILSQALNTGSVQNTHVHPALRHLRMKCCHDKIINSLPQSYSHSMMTCTQPHPSPQQHRLWTRTTDGHSRSPWELLTGRTTQRKLHATSPPSLRVTFLMHPAQPGRGSEFPGVASPVTCNKPSTSSYVLKLSFYLKMETS